jgi:peptidoglycan/LPS O-acetylase OafA/YrhL
MLVIMNVQVFYNYLGARPGDSLFLYGTVTVAIALLVAQVSYVFIERPFLKRKMRFARSTDQRRSASRRLSGEVGGVPVGLEPMNGFRGDPKAPFPPAL